MELQSSKREKTSRALLKQALLLFQKKGYESVTMRELATSCELSLGAFYYHFKNKEELVLEFYTSSFAGHVERTEGHLSDKKPKLHETMRWICQDRFEEFSAHRFVLQVLAQRLDPSDPISPWHISSTKLRQGSIDLFSKVVATCMPGLDEKNTRVLARALWLQHLLILGYWSFDKSAKQQNTESLLRQSAYVWKSLPRLLNIPGFKSTLALLLEPLTRVEGRP